MGAVYVGGGVGGGTMLLHNVNLQVVKEDMWLWTLESSKDFTVQSAYKFLLHHHQQDTTVSSKFLSHKDVPLKVVLFAWRLFRDRLPTKDNLCRRGVLDPDACLCVGGCGSVETSPHLFLHCHFFGEVWHFIHRWLGVCSVLPDVPADHFNQFGHVCGNCSKVRHSIMHWIWYATVWTVWKERNNKIFNDKIKSVSFVWLKVKIANLSFNYHAWWLSPISMLGIG